MKRMISLTFLLSFLALSGLAQVKFGVKAGFNASTTKFEHHPSYGRSKYNLSYQAGIFTTTPVGENHFIQPELFYSRKTWRVDNVHFKDDYSNNLGYLNLPLLMGYRFSGKTFIVSGPEFGYLVWTDVPENWWNRYKRFEAGV